MRQDIVEKAREQLGESDIRPVDSLVSSEMAGSRPMTQREINEAADTVIRDLFPRIPNTDRQEIIDRAFRKVRKF